MTEVEVVRHTSVTTSKAKFYCVLGHVTVKYEQQVHQIIHGAIIFPFVNEFELKYFRQSWENCKSTPDECSTPFTLVM